MSTEKKTRREVLASSVALGCGLATTAFLAACGKEKAKELSCNDTIGMPPADLATRENNAYVDHAPDPAKQCSGCQLYQAKAEGQCGGCTVVKGPINPKGYCKLFTAKQPA
jgi:hypothetical protein